MCNLTWYILILDFNNMKNQLKKPFRVAIEGNVGSGKSTLIKYFETFKNVDAHPVSTYCFVSYLYV